MAATEQMTGDAAVIEEEMPARPRGATLSGDTKLAASCMLWAMIIGLAFLVGVMLIWGIGHIGTVFQ